MIFKKRKKGKGDLTIKKDNLPHHIAFIMDGNGRWAKKRGLPRTAGHSEGGKALLKVLQAANDLNIKAVTVFAFSTENWTRPQEEVNFLMNLPNKYINTYLPKMKKENMRMNFIGDIEPLPKEIKNNIQRAVTETRDNTGLIFTIAINYGSKDEILRTTKIIAEEYKKDNVTMDDINNDYFESKLMTSNLPNIDLLVRTSGEFRVSNFLLWQIAYSELYFTEKYWPDFDEGELNNAIIEYQKRHRRYGGL